MTSSGARARPRALLVAYSCSPYRGSEHIVGWGRIRQAARAFDTWVLCSPQSEADVRRYVAEHGPVPGLQVGDIGTKALEAWVERRFPADQLDLNWFAYHLWHRRAYAEAKALHRALAFDLVHQVNICGYREPGYLWKLGAPFVWGPVGGTQNVPTAFLPALGRGPGLREALRTAANHVQLRFSPRVRRAARRAAVVLVANSTGERDFQRVFGLRPVRLLETGLPALPAPAPSRAPADHAVPLRILWSGKLITRKGLRLLLEALARVPRHVAWELRVLGDGPERSRYQADAARLGIADRCAWLGFVPFAEVEAHYRTADTFVFTSLRDTSGNVMLEALAAGVPVVCLDHQGAHDIVSETSGVMIPVTTPAEAVAALADAVVRLATDRAHLARLAAGARERAREFLWEANAARMLEVYRQAMGGTPSERPQPSARPRRRPASAVA